MWPAISRPLSAETLKTRNTEGLLLGSFTNPHLSAFCCCDVPNKSLKKSNALSRFRSRIPTWTSQAAASSAREIICKDSTAEVLAFSVAVERPHCVSLENTKRAGYLQQPHWPKPKVTGLWQFHTDCTNLERKNLFTCFLFRIAKSKLMNTIQHKK